MYVYSRVMCLYMDHIYTYIYIFVYNVYMQRQIDDRQVDKQIAR